jgi:hypothetical protein
MRYRDFFTRRYMLDYSSALSWADTFTLLWCLYNNKWIVVPEEKFSENYWFTFMNMYSRRIGKCGIRGNWHTA